MTKKLVPVAATMVAMAAMAACSHVERGNDKAPRPTAPPVVEALAVEASIMSAVLEEDCKQADASDVARGGRLGRSAADPADPARADRARAMAKRACEQARVQLLLRSAAGSQPARIEIASVKLLDDKDGRELAELVARNPQQWAAATSTYQPWDSTIAPSQQLQTSFDLSAPDWDAIGGGSRWNTQGMSFRLVVTLRVDGKDKQTQLTVRSPFIVREPMMRT
ncbi:MAG: hypothetical protein IT370_02140 [Deltaproteobacteria bacterium]|nr:hypothetical protein [Deltaproteobacteria bacterium]